ncbi:hypothetical protein J132_11255 [Termitomyces sp. J132]|nr:hypothetical protein H2248_011561 [Termitomyces sp. 'cryptogamus']KNZ81621.1 hypothetical protein J132_11255 [Termitomyces sp. J132]
MGSENSTVIDHLQRNPHYYLSGGDAYFLVENQIFRVHRYFLERESHVFQEWFQGPQAPGAFRNGESRNGESESAAILLRDVTPAAFEKLLDVFYNPKYSVYGWPIEDWITIIQVAQKWEFSQVLELALRELEKIEIPLISRIALYQRFDIDRSHLLPLYGKLCTRPKALDYQESNAIGLATTVVIFNARERLRARPLKDGKSLLPAEFQDSEVYMVLTDLLVTSG